MKYTYRFSALAKVENNVIHRLQLFCEIKIVISKSEFIFCSTNVRGSISLTNQYCELANSNLEYWMRQSTMIGFKNLT